MLWGKDFGRSGSYDCVTVIRIELGELAREGIEAHLGDGAEVCAREAMQRYADRLGASETPLSLPCFIADEPSRAAPGTGCLELELDVEVQEVLEREAERQRVPVAQIASHAVLAYLAELDAVGAIRESG